MGLWFCFGIFVASRSPLKIVVFNFGGLAGSKRPGNRAEFFVGWKVLSLWNLFPQNYSRWFNDDFKNIETDYFAILRI
ncbi:MAG: hypothetical protein JXA71_19540 [Chitinispirillaceae bacterium]|nr:hypothetical protein [Chitinispirillaceae bacterium]